ncbi:MAG: immunoglobulin-like domain-containing protein [Clostridia bacterium]|jgi:uncharacterized membrane protein
MKRYFYLLVGMIIILALFAGCKDDQYFNTSKATEKTAKENNSTESPDTTDWSPTTYETVNNLNGVTMTVKQGTVSSTQLTVIIENRSGSDCIFGEFFDLEKKINGVWHKLPVTFDGDYGFNSIGYDLPPEESREWTVDWEWLYGSLEAGEYRIVKDILDFRDAGDYDTYYLAAEFIIN